MRASTEAKKSVPKLESASWPVEGASLLMVKMSTTVSSWIKKYFLFYLLILVVKAEFLWEANLITVLFKNPMERRQGRKCKFLDAGEKP